MPLAQFLGCASNAVSAGLQLARVQNDFSLWAAGLGISDPITYFNQWSYKSKLFQLISDSMINDPTVRSIFPLRRECKV